MRRRWTVAHVLPDAQKLVLEPGTVYGWDSVSPERGGMLTAKCGGCGVRREIVAPPDLAHHHGRTLGEHALSRAGWRFVPPWNWIERECFRSIERQLKAGHLQLAVPLQVGTENGKRCRARTMEEAREEPIRDPNQREIFMSKITVFGHTEVRATGDTLEAAVQAFKEQYGFLPEEWESETPDDGGAILGACESCGKLLLADATEYANRGYLVDEDGTMLCGCCCDEAAADARAMGAADS